MPSARPSPALAVQVEELQRATSEMSLAVDAAKSYFAEEAKLSPEEFFSRWALFLGQLDTAVANQQADAQKRARARK